MAIALSVALALAANGATAHAITRQEVLKRAGSWIAKEVPYSQSSYFDGYRQDCSGFVSMAWKLGDSYTSSTVDERAKKISWRDLKPGDAVQRSGHVEIFGGWENKGERRYWALEESTWGKPALRKVKSFESGYNALRRDGITDATPQSKPSALASGPVLPHTAVLAGLPTSGTATRGLMARISAAPSVGTLID